MTDRDHLRAVPDYTPPRPLVDVKHWTVQIKQAIAEAKAAKERKRKEPKP